MVLGTMVCLSFVLGGDANTCSAGYVCFETEFVEGEFDFHAAMLLRLPLSCFWACPRFSQWFSLVPRRFSWVERMISLPRCLLRSLMPR